MTTLTFWQNMPSIHQAALISNVAEKWPGPVHLITEFGVSGSRIQQGWTLPDFGQARVSIGLSRSARDAHLAANSTSDAIHLFSGISAYPETSRTLYTAIENQLKVGVFAEPGRNNDGLKAIVRKWKYRLDARRYGPYISFLFATGATGLSWYEQVGYPREKVFKFGYFVPRPELPENVTLQTNTDPIPKSIRVIFVGALEKHKAVDVLLRAVAGLNVELTIIGSGREYDQLRRLSETFNFVARVSWLGNLPNHEVVTLISEHDCLILPSRYDGWGAVVNEALMVGTPVIVSSACGAADLIQYPWLGTVIRPNDVAGLTAAVTAQIRKGRITNDQRDRIQAWSDASIAPNAAAQYLVGILRHSLPDARLTCAPWESDSVTSTVQSMS